MTVLVGFDGSVSSMAALRWAGAYARAHGDELEVLRTWQYPASVPIQVPTPERLRPADDVDAAVAAEIGDLVAAELPGTRATVTVRRGAAAEHLIERTTDPSVRALVLGSRGLGGFSKLVLGSVTRACLEHSSAPVVVVRHDRPHGVGRVLVGVDGSDGSRAALRWACEAARRSVPSS
jgi:nucleotide-binding universal stress UspA family protein